MFPIFPDIMLCCALTETDPDLYNFDSSLGVYALNVNENKICITSVQ